MVLKSAAIIAGINQGDQIGRILDYLEVVHFGQFYETYKSSPNILATFLVKVMHTVWQRMCWTTFWAIFFSN
jgi:hypothetical protein